jgi:DNA-directed RNA polymerase subunit K/omega
MSDAESERESESSEYESSEESLEQELDDIIVKDKANEVNKLAINTNRATPNIMSLEEKTAIICQRITDIESGSKPMLDTTNLDGPAEIALAEFNNGLIYFTIKRDIMHNKDAIITEYVKATELVCFAE